jgi:hypothetical protein
VDNPPPPPSLAAARRLLAFVLGLLVLAGGLELLVRWNEPLFAAATHRALAKAAMFDRHPRVDFLFLGTSRTQDGVSPALVSQGLEALSPDLRGVPGYNAAFTSASLDALESLSGRFLSRPELRLIVIELSDPQTVNPPTPWDGSKPDETTVEGRLALLARGVRFIRHRSAFLSDNIARLPALLVFAPALGGWEVKGVDQVATWLGRREPVAAGFDAAAWKPALLRPGGDATRLDAERSAIADRFVAVAARYRARGKTVVFASPPLARDWSPAPERDSLKGMFAEVARRSGCEVWDFSSLALPERFFRNPSHLGDEGRAHFSRALAVEMVRHLTPK